jgi:hypothetical protein
MMGGLFQQDWRLRYGQFSVDIMAYQTTKCLCVFFLHNGDFARSSLLCTSLRVPVVLLCRKVIYCGI